jgi:hypothetical protein
VGNDLRVSMIISSDQNYSITYNPPITARIKMHSLIRSRKVGADYVTVQRRIKVGLVRRPNGLDAKNDSTFRLPENRWPKEIIHQTPPAGRFPVSTMQKLSQLKPRSLVFHTRA